MKKVLLSLLFLAGIAASAAPASAGLRDYKLGLPLQFRTSAVGARDLQHGDWLAGNSVDVLWLRRRGENEPVVYLAGNQLWDLDQKWKGMFGGAIGISTGKAGETIGKALGIIAPDQVDRLQWLQTLGNWVSIEGGGGYKFFGVPQGQSHWFYTLGGKVRIPIEKLWERE